MGSELSNIQVGLRKLQRSTEQSGCFFKNPFGAGRHSHTPLPSASSGYTKFTMEPIRRHEPLPRISLQSFGSLVFPGAFYRIA